MLCLHTSIGLPGSLSFCFEIQIQLIFSSTCSFKARRKTFPTFPALPFTWLLVLDQCIWFRRLLRRQPQQTWPICTLPWFQLHHLFKRRHQFRLLPLSVQLLSTHLISLLTIRTNIIWTKIVCLVYHCLLHRLPFKLPPIAFHWMNLIHPDYPITRHLLAIITLHPLVLRTALRHDRSDPVSNKTLDRLATSRRPINRKFAKG